MPTFSTETCPNVAPAQGLLFTCKLCVVVLAEAAQSSADADLNTASDLGALIRDSLQQQPGSDTEAAPLQAPPVQEAGPPDVPQPLSQAPEASQATCQAPEMPQSPAAPEVPQALGDAATEAARPVPSNDAPAEASSLQAQDPSSTVEPMPVDVPPSGDCQADAGPPWLCRGLQWRQMFAKPYVLTVTVDDHV